jgi:hypothetical protein
MLSQHPDLAMIDAFSAGDLDHSIFVAIQDAPRYAKRWTDVLRCAHCELLPPERGIKVEHRDAIGACSRLRDCVEIATFGAL